MKKYQILRIPTFLLLLVFGALSAWAQDPGQAPITSDVRVQGEVWADRLRLGQTRMTELPGAPASGLVVSSPSSETAIELRPGGGPGLQMRVGPSEAWLTTIGYQSIVLATQKSTSVGLVLNPGGNIGIGTRQPTERLEVNGNLRVSNGNIIVNGANLAVPDYVFGDDYSLRTLDQLGAFIEKEGHLPNIPSAREIQREGLNLSEFQLRLLEKIEELTLYTLMQQREIDQLQQSCRAPR